jgi:hypothetical protein
MSIPDEEFDVLGEEELALLSRSFDRLHESRRNARRSSGTCYKCGKGGHFIAECPEVEENKYKMSEYKAHPRREDKYSSRASTSASPGARTRTSDDRARAATRRTRQEPWWPVQATSTQAQATRSQAQAVKMKTPGGTMARRVQVGTSVD